MIEQFEPQDIVILSRQPNGVLEGAPIDLGDFKTKSFKTERRQFAEAILGRGVLVVEGASEVALFPEASTILERSLGADVYMHLDFAGILADEICKNRALATCKADAPGRESENFRFPNRFQMRFRQSGPFRR